MIQSGAVLGCYRLRARLGAGMAGEVWSAHHPDIDVEVAIKILHSADPVAVAREVQTLASLRHPGIVFPYDHGEHEGGAWIAMELARGGSLSDLPTGDWATVRPIVRQLLDALAHAHAHGIIHRDIKGPNVLVFPGEGVKVSDFSIASPRQGPAASARVGSLVTMAPEQLQGTLADQGPWTDLFALGCLTFTCLTGAPPWGGPDAARLRLTTPMPRLPWPEVDAWVRWLTARDPTARPRCAAEALTSLPQAIASTGGPALPSPMLLDATLTRTAETEDLGALPRSGAWRPWSAPLPADWRRADAMPRLLPGAGLGLLALRPAPPRGRDTIRDRLWQRVRTGTGWTHLEGAAGSGRAHLLQVTATRAAELGATAWQLPRRASLAALVRVACGLSADGDRPLHAALVRTGWRLGIPSDQLAQLEGAPSPEALRTLLSASSGPRLLAAPEPGDDLLAFLVNLPDIVVLTTGGPGSQPAGAVRIHLPPLPSTEIRRLIADRIELEPSLAAAVVDRADGLPGRALGEVLGWATAGMLHPGPRGYTAAIQPGRDDPGDPQLVLAAARTWLRQAQQDRALSVLDAALAALDRSGSPPSDPTRLRILRGRILVLLGLGALDEVETSCHALLAIPDLSDDITAVAAAGLSDVYTTRGEPARALALLDQLVPPGVHSDSIAQYRATARLSLGVGLAASVAEVSACLENTPEPRLRISLLRQQAILALAMKAPAADDLIAMAMEGAPPERHHVLRFIRGDIALLLRGDPAAALADYDAALAGYAPAAPNRLLVTVNRGIALLALGDVAGARAAAREARPLLFRSGHRDHEAVAHALAWATEADADLALDHGRRARMSIGSHPITAQLITTLEGLRGRVLPEGS